MQRARLLVISTLALAAFAAVGLTLALAPRFGPDAEASHNGGTVALYALDMDPTTAPANTIDPAITTDPGAPDPDTEAATLGTIQTCISVTHPATVNVDVVVKGWPSGLGDRLVGYTARVGYPSGLSLAVVKAGSDLTAGNRTLLTADPQSGSIFAGVLEAGGAGPNTWDVSMIDFSPQDLASENIDGEEDIEGFLARVAFTTTAAGPALRAITLGGFPSDDAGAMTLDVPPQGGTIAVDTPCPEVTSVSTASPAGVEVNTAFAVTADVAISNVGGVDAVNVDTTVQLNLPPDCTTPETNPVTVQDTPVSVAGSPLSLPQQSWSVMCTQPSFHAFTTTAMAIIDDFPLALPASNTRTSASSTTAVTAEANVAVDSVDAGGDPQATVNVPFLVDSNVVVSNAGPFDPVGVAVGVTLSLPADCTTSSGNPQFPTAQVPTIGPVAVVAGWSVTCTLNGLHTFPVDADVTPPNVHVSDPVGGNNSGSGQGAIAVAPDADADGIGDPFDTEGPPPNNSGIGGQDDCFDGRDNDADGLIDAADPGCPDADGDGVLDLIDNCPATPNANQSDADADGLGDLCDSEGPSPNNNGVGGLNDCFDAADNDADGLTDWLDFGCDFDGDGVPPAFDACATQPEDMDGYQDGDGCPDTDNDMDGICDPWATPILPSCTGSDSCPNVVEDVDAFKDGDGCPEPDNDADGFPDAVDDCPGTDYTAGPDGIADSGDEPQVPLPTLTKEDYDGILDGDGCHDSPGDDFDGDALTDEDEVFIFLTNPAKRDSDGDRIDDGVDGLNFGGDRATFISTNFSDRPGGSTLGSIADPQGAFVTVMEAPNPDGVRISVAWFGGPALIDACGVTLEMPGNTESVVTCGSARVKVLKGPIAVIFDTIEASVPAGATFTVSEVGPGSFDLSNSPGSMQSVSVGGLTLAPGESAAAVTDVDSDGWISVVDNCATVATVWFVPASDGDCDGWRDAIETAAASDPLAMGSSPERCNGIDDDLNEGIDEGCATDGDGDGSSNAREAYNGTDGADACPNSSTHDAWVFDTNRNRKVDVNDLLGVPSSFKSSFGADVTDPAYNRRFDFNPDASAPGGAPDIDINDLLGNGRSFKNSYGTSCVP